MTDENQKKLKEINEKLKEIMLRHMEKPDVCASAINGLTLVRRETVNSSERCFEKSLASVISRAASPPSWAHRNFIYTRTNVVFPGWTCRARPMLSAPRRPPFLSLFFYLDRQILSDLVMEMEPEERPSFMEGQGVSVADAEPEFMETMLRLAELPGKPNQIPIRTPIIMRELHHLLLTDPQGGALQGLYTRGSRNNQNERAASAALSAGYESVTQFNREYKRMFGEPPHRDISRRRYMA